jgi:hypothetical protein
MSRVFISYRHSDGAWVWNRLTPCLEAGGAEVLIDRQRFQAGIAVAGQMDATQDHADVHVLVITKEYLESDYCRHEMDRAVALDADFQHGIVVPVRRDDHRPWPRKITKSNPLYVDLRNDADTGQWELLLRACGADLGTTAPAWLTARDEVVKWLKRNESVNLVVGRRVKWQPLIDHIRQTALPDLKHVDLQTGFVAARPGLLTGILRQYGIDTSLPSKPDDLVAFDRFLESLPRGRLALTHFDLAGTPERQQEYGIDLFAALRHLTMTKKKLILLIESHRAFATLLPPNHPLSEIDVKTVELP